MIKLYLKKSLKRSILALSLILSTTTLFSQLSGTVTIGIEYVSINDFLIDLNTNGVLPGGGGVTLLVPAGYTETAPAGGFVITATGTAAENITIAGVGGLPNPIITASGSLTAGNLNDGIFKLIGSDYVNIIGLDLRENAANTTTTAASNNMTEWGVALLYTSATDGANNCSIVGNTITLNRTYQNTFGIYSNSTHTAAAVTTSATATGATGGNSGLKVYGNNISNVNLGILVVGPTAAADHNNGIDIGGTAVNTGNVITNFGTTGTFSSFANVSGTVYGILVRNSKNFNVSYNTVTSSVGGTTAGTLRGIFIQSFSNAPTGTFSNTINNNTVSLQTGFATGVMESITHQGTSATNTSTCTISNNNFLNTGHTVAGTAAITFITAQGTYLTSTISNNTFTNMTVNTTGSVQFINHGYIMPVGSTLNITGNSIVTGFTKTGAGGTNYVTYSNSSSPNGAFINYINNNFSNINLNGASSLTVFNNTDGTTGTSAKTFTGNTINNVTGGTSAITGINLTYLNGTNNISTNTITNISGQGSIAGISIGSSLNSGTVLNISSNTITGLSSIGAGGAVTAIATANTSPNINISDNQINTLSSNGASLVCGISITGGTSTSAIANKIYGLTSSNAGGTVFGIQSTAGTAISIYNNLISGLTAPIASNNDAIRGISISSSTSSSVYGVYYNTIYLNASSTGTNFGTSGIFHTANATATTAALDLRNNIIINESAFAGTGLTAAFRRSGTALNNYAATSNRNMFYAGSPSATNLIMYDGTNSYQTLAAYQAVVSPRDINSMTGEAFTYGTPGSFFISLTGSSSDFLRPVAGIVTQVESGGQNITSPAITTDYTGVIRAGNPGYVGTGTNPDLGAYEFEGVTPAPVITLNSVTPPTTTQCTTTPRTVSVNITTSSGTITGANLVFAFNGIAQTPVVMTNTSGSTWEGIIPVAVPSNATVTWGVTATNSLGLSSSLDGTAYSDEPLTGVVATASASSTTTCAGSPTTLSVALTKAGSSVSGTSAGTSSSSSSSPFYHGYGGVKTQYIYRASELTAMGFVAGNFTSISLNITSLGTPTLNGFSISVGHTAQNAAVTNTAILAGLVPVYSNAAQPLILGTNNYTFSTPFSWDGISNIVISFNYSNNNTGGTSSAVSTDAALGFTSSLAIYADNATAACLLSAPSSGQACMGTNGNSTTSTRPTMTFSGQKSVAVTSVTWMDGVTTVGTGNPFSVSPTTTTTYSANITALGCTYSPAPTVTVTVNPLPSAPTATNSAQCGTQVPTASVTSTTGATTPTFNWYDAAVGGTLLQSSTSTTFTSNVTSTVTMYVSEVNGTTLCESPRTAVTITVAAADGIQASVAVSTICVGGTANLSVVNTNPTPVQNYTYSWSGPAGSGAETPVAGASVNITPTASGTFTYTVTGVDASCNAVSSVDVTVSPFTAVLAPINITCNGYNNGSFSQTSETCGTGPFTYSVDGGAFGAIPTNLTPGTHTVIVKNSLGFNTSSINLTITEPAATILAATVVNASVCEGSASAMVSASYASAPITGSVVVNFDVSTQPTELSSSTVPTVAASPNPIAVATMPALPVGATITSATLTYNNIQALSSSWRSDVRLGLSGSITQAYSQGSSLNSAGTFNYTFNIPVGSISTAGGVVTLHYFDYFNDNTSGAEATFPTGTSVAAVTINYSVPTTATVSWWNASTAGTQIGTGSPFETVGTSVLPNTNTPGTYTLFVQGELGGCITPTRTPVTVTVKAETFSTLTVTACDSYTLNTQTYTSSGTYTQLMTNAAGCDSTITLNLTIKNSSSSTTTLTSCNTYTWTNGVTYTTSGTYTQTLVNAVGCDSVATLALTINYSNSGTQNTTACDTYTWPATGLAYTTSGVYTTTLTNAAGCDSSVTLNLTINNSSSGMQSITACNSYTWPANGVTYTTGGNYFATLTNSAGCDSNVMLMLTINYSSSSSQTATACDSYVWPTNGTTYTLSGMYTATLTNAVGCDSVVTLNLTINNSITNTSTISECDSYTWPVNGVTYTVGGTYSALFTTTDGCDSTEILNLTLNYSTSGSETVTACDTFTWAANGVTYTGSGMFMATLTNAAGCDSNVMLMLTIYTSPTYTQTVTACDSYTWPLNNVTYSTGGTYTTIVPATVGCDTIVTLQLTINNSSTSTTTVAQCGPYTWTDGNTYSSSGTFTQTLTNAVGCDSVATLILTIHGYPTAVATDNGDASMTANTSTSYQWINCTTGNPIAGATSQTYTATVNDSYAVIVTNAAGCADTSDCVVIDYIGIREIEKDMFTVYPNPTLDQVTISMTVSSANIEVVDAQGKLLQVLTIENGGKVDLRSYETGVYYLRITSDNITEIQRVVKN